MQCRGWIVALATIAASLGVVSSAAAPSIDATSAADFELLAAVRSAAGEQTVLENRDRIAVAVPKIEVEAELGDEDDERDSSSTVERFYDKDASTSIEDPKSPPHPEPAQPERQPAQVQPQERPHHPHHHQQQQQNGRTREVRCFCNQPECVSQGYMCLGRGCFTELPVLQLGSSAKVAAAGLARTRLLSQQLLAAQQHQYPIAAEQLAAYSGCLTAHPSGGHQQGAQNSNCPPGRLCCEQDMCNHIDSPAMRHRLNKTLHLLLGEQSAYLGSISSLGGGVGVSSGGPSGQQIQNSSSDGWFRTATIAVPICGFVVLLILASLAIRLLQPIPSPNDKLVGLRLPEAASPPLLGHHHIHHHHHHHNKLPLV